MSQKKAPARRPAARRARARSAAAVPKSSPSSAGRVIYDSPLKPRHLSRAQIETIVDEIPG